MTFDPSHVHLEELATRLAHEGLCARLTQPIGKPPSLHVLNPDLPMAEESVIIELSSSETWFWWAWAERIAPTGDLDGAVSGIRRVLGAA